MKLFVSRNIIVASVFAGVIVVVVATAVVGKETFATKNTSPEIGLAETSPNGVSGGYAIPASCPSDLHGSPLYGQACTLCNACGNCNTGVYQCGNDPPCTTVTDETTGLTTTQCHGQVCSVDVPPLPPGLGDPCVKTNACGESYPFEDICSGQKAVPFHLVTYGTDITCPPRTVPFVAGGITSCYEEQCTHASRSHGYIQCDGTCSGIAPPERLDEGNTCKSSPNNCGATGNGIIHCGVCDAFQPPDEMVCRDTLTVCMTSCHSGSPVDSSFAMADTESKSLVACYSGNTTCTNDSTIANVTTDATWTGTDLPKDAVKLTQSGSAEIVTANQITATGVTKQSENIEVSYSGSEKTVTANVSRNCSGCTDGALHCQGEPYTMTNNCGESKNCFGTRSCDFNWVEVAP